MLVHVAFFIIYLGCSLMFYMLCFLVIFLLGDETKYMFILDFMSFDCLHYNYNE